MVQFLQFLNRSDFQSGNFNHRHLRSIWSKLGTILRTQMTKKGKRVSCSGDLPLLVVSQLITICILLYSSQSPFLRLSERPCPLHLGGTAENILQGMNQTEQLIYCQSISLFPSLSLSLSPSSTGQVLEFQRYLFVLSTSPHQVVGLIYTWPSPLSPPHLPPSASSFHSPFLNPFSFPSFLFISPFYPSIVLPITSSIYPTIAY